jgi:hypothetical protein
VGIKKEVDRKTIQQFAEASLSCALTSCGYENDGEIGSSSLTVR